MMAGASGEPTALYLERTAYGRAGYMNPQEKAQAKADVLAFVDKHLTDSYQAFASYLENRPDAPGVRAAERIMRHLVEHPSIADDKRHLLATMFNQNVVLLEMNDGKSSSDTVALLDTPGNTLLPPVDGMAAVR